MGNAIQPIAALNPALSSSKSIAGRSIAHETLDDIGQLLLLNFESVAVSPGLLFKLLILLAPSVLRLLTLFVVLLLFTTLCSSLPLENPSISVSIINLIVTLYMFSTFSVYRSPSVCCTDVKNGFSIFCKDIRKWKSLVFRVRVSQEGTKSDL